MKRTFIVAAAILGLAACSHKQPQETVAPPVATGPQKAQAVLKSVKGQNIKGMIHFTEEGGVMKIETMVDNLKSGPHGFHIHENGDCSAADFATAGGHFNPHGTKHGSKDSMERHVGDFGNLTADNKRKAYTTLTVPGLSLTGSHGIIGKAVIIHKDKDDLKSQPTGNAGGRIACGVIEAL